MYQHDGSETISDQFTYQAVDELGEVTAVTTVFITIAPVNDVPQAATDRYTTTEDDILQVGAPGVLANDSDADIGDSLIVSAFDAVSAGRRGGDQSGRRIGVQSGRLCGPAGPQTGAVRGRHLQLHHSRLGRGDKYRPW